MRRFNYTGRKKILKQDVLVQLHGGFNEPPIVNVSVDLADYGFPAGAEVFLEPQLKTRFSRHHLGLVAPSVRRNAIRLSNFDDAEGLDFRIKVVDQSAGVLLGFAENIKPVDKDNELDRNRQSILPVVSADLGQYGVLWRIDIDGQSAVLQVERDLGGREQVVRSLLFRGFILPAGMRQILVHILADDWDDDLTDPAELSTRWLLFCRQLGAGLPEKGVDSNEIWLDEAIRLLCAQVGVRQNILDEFDAGVWK